MYLLLYALWIALNGKFTAEICLLGVAVVAAVALIALVLFQYTPGKELRLYRKAPLFLAYIGLLIWEIVKANFSVLRFILNEKAHIEPSMMSFDVPLRTETARFLLANSITLTPGTITVYTHGDRFTVHALTEEMLDGIERSPFVRLLQKLEA